MIYVKQIGNSWTFCNEHGNCVHSDGSLAYHPDFFDKRPEGYPLYIATPNKA
jgi:hypothetical protein